MYKYIYWFKFRNPPRDFKPVVLVTGCSSGIGEAIAELMVKRKAYRVVLTARRQSLHILKEKFQESERIKILALDVTEAESRRQVIGEIENDWGGVDILVNNAGISYRSTLEEMSYEDEQLQMETNYHGPIDLIRLCLPSMRSKGRGKIINISSVSGMLAMPTMSSYSASKYALEGASEALWYEAKPFGISVSLIQPGFVKSHSFERVRFSLKSEKSHHGEGPYGAMYNSMEPFIARLMNHGLATPQSIANLVQCVIRTQNPPLWIPASFDAEFFYYLRRIFPRRLLQPFLYFCLPKTKNWGRQYSRKRAQLIWPLSSIRSWLQRRSEEIDDQS
jgi:short-subunit dehydrogenase